MRMLTLAVVGIATAATALPGLAGSAVTPYVDLRVRQESLDGVYHFAADTDRNWIRVRTRFGVLLSGDRHDFDLRLTNEHRHYIHPDADFDWDELVVDRAAWTRRGPGGRALTVGRQDIIWPGGFLMLEGHPLDGSRSIYHDAIRWRSPWLGGELDVALIQNSRRDRFVLAGDQDRALTDRNETGLAARYDRGGWQGSLIAKSETDPDGLLDDRTTVTGAGRWTGETRVTGRVSCEIAVQHQHRRGDGDGWALAFHASGRRQLGRGFEVEMDGFYYSGASGDLRAFRTPWGRWPKWSELYVYTLIGESTPDRVHVAAWENIAAPRLTLHRTLSPRLSGRLGVAWLLAPEPDWESRGVLTRAGVTFDLGAGAAGHLLWERLAPGAFHDGRHDLPPLTDTVHFLRWQITYAFK